MNMRWIVGLGMSAGLGLLATSLWADDHTTQVAQAMTSNETAQAALPTQDNSTPPLTTLSVERTQAEPLPQSSTETGTAFGMPLRQVRQIIDATRQTDPEVAAEIERQLHLLEHPQVEEDTTLATPRLVGAMNTVISETAQLSQDVIPMEQGIEASDLVLPLTSLSSQAGLPEDVGTLGSAPMLSDGQVQEPSAELGRE